MSKPLLEVTDLATHFPIAQSGLPFKAPHMLKAVDGVSFTLEEGDVMGLVGESGCGKSTLARSILQLVPQTAGTVILSGKNLSTLSKAELRAMRPEAQLIFQDPYASLNPRMTIFNAIAEPLLQYGHATRADVSSHVAALMEKVGLAPRFMRKYPHEFSGGQRQRIAIARTLALKPRLILADEPVSALDVSVQAQILNLIADLCRDENLTMLFISHDLAVVRHVARTIAVMYLGRIVEIAPSDTLFENPQHPYTQALISAVPLPDPVLERARDRIVLKGDPPSPIDPPTGCPFHPRCHLADADCANKVPVLKEHVPGTQAACLKLD